MAANLQSAEGFVKDTTLLNVLYSAAGQRFRSNLFAIDEAERPNQTQLTERPGVDRSTLSDVVRRLQKRR